MGNRDNHALGPLRRAVRDLAGLEVLALFGSRAGDSATPHSDWDFAFQATADFNLDALFVGLARTLGTDKIDLVDLGCAGGLVRFRVARDGVLIFEARPGAFHDFCYAAAIFWCDAGAIVEAAHEALLSRYGATSNKR